MAAQCRAGFNGAVVLAVRVTRGGRRRWKGPVLSFCDGDLGKDDAVGRVEVGTCAVSWVDGIFVKNGQLWRRCWAEMTEGGGFEEARAELDFLSAAFGFWARGVEAVDTVADPLPRVVSRTATIGEALMPVHLAMV